jgi:hypothetical protein
MVMKKAALAVAAVAVLIAFGSQTHAAADRHFRATIDLVETGPLVPDARCPAGTVLVSLTGSGNVTRAGRVSVAASHCIVDDPAVEPFTDGEMTLSGKGGDIFIEYEGNDAAGDLTGTFVITGGTGDFAGASGGGTLTGRAGIGGGRGRLDGTISLP